MGDIVVFVVLVEEELVHSAFVTGLCYMLHVTVTVTPNTRKHTHNINTTK
jgi:Na+-transporting NADH:ubiquinone oxidoreductase subunit NqrB